MGWKDLPSWLKGGVIFSSIVLIFYLIALVGENITNGFGGLDFIIVPVFLLLVLLSAPLIFIFSKLGLFNLFFNSGEMFGSSPKLLGGIALLIFYFLIGALIGWIVGKIKSKNSKTPSSKNLKGVKK